MFKKFDESSLASHNKAKSSVLRKSKAEIIRNFPEMEEYIESQVFAKKGSGDADKDYSMHLATCKTAGKKFDFILDSAHSPLFLKIKGGGLFPNLRVLHRFPTALPRFQVDKGAIPFVLRGADIFCSGLTSAGGNIPENPDSEDGHWDKGTVVGVFAEGKKHACAIGILARRSSKIGSSGVGIEVVLFLGDDLWKIKSF